MIIHSYLNIEYYYFRSFKTIEIVFKWFYLFFNINLSIDILGVKLINQFKIQFPNTKTLTIKFNNKGLKEMKKLISNSFPSQLSSFIFISNWKEGWSYYFNHQDSFRCVECLQTTNSSITIQNYVFNKPKQLCDSIQFFKKASSIEFKDWFYWDWEVGMEDTEFEGVQINHIIFNNCQFANTKMIKKVIIDSGLANMLDKVSFNEFMIGKVDVNKMIEEYRNATGKINFEVV